MGMEQNQANERVENNNSAETAENTAVTRMSEEANSSALSKSSDSSTSQNKVGEKDAKELDFNTGKAVEKSDATPKQIAENIAKDGTFGQGDKRFDTEMTLNKALKDGNSKEVVGEINKELAAAGSKLTVQEQISGGGSGSADRMVNGVRTSTRENSREGEFTVKGENGQTTDSMKLSNGSSERIENGKVVGGNSWSKGENGASAGSWGKAPRDAKGGEGSSPYKLNNLIIDGMEAQSSGSNNAKASSKVVHPRKK